ncbi:MAG TPA: PAS domain S-box protein, partial [Polyangiaceae bacterium]
MTPERGAQSDLAQRFRVADIMQTSMDGCWILDPEGCFVEVNDAYCQLIGFDREELIGQSISFVEARETPDLTRAHIRRVLELGGDRFETQHRKKDGGLLDIEVSASRLGQGADQRHVFLVFLRDITARKRWEEGLRAASEDRLSLALASVDMAVFQQDRDLKYTWMTHPQLGYSTEDVIGKTDLVLLPPADAQRVVDLKRRVLDTGEAAREVVPVTVGETTSYYDIVVRPVRDPEGAIVGVAGASLNLTGRVRAERALEASEARYRLLFEKSTEAVFVIDRRTGRFVSANPAAEELTGRSLGDLVQRTLFEIAPAVARDHWPHLEASKELWDLGEVTHVRPDGAKRVAALSIVPLGDDLLVGFAHDLTARKVGEDKLLTLSSAIERSTASIVITDAGGNIEYVNPKFTEVTGYSAAEALGKNSRFLQSGRTPPAEHRRLWETILGGREWRGEFENRRKDGETLWESASIASITNDAGVITHFVAVKEDITDRKRA